MTQDAREWPLLVLETRNMMNVISILKEELPKAKGDKAREIREHIYFLQLHTVLSVCNSIAGKEGLERGLDVELMEEFMKTSLLLDSYTFFTVRLTADGVEDKDVWAQMGKYVKSAHVLPTLIDNTRIGQPVHAFNKNDNDTFFCFL
eukprot:1275593-Rhodomonas_salina.1